MTAAVAVAVAVVVVTAAAAARRSVCGGGRAGGRADGSGRAGVTDLFTISGSVRARTPAIRRNEKFIKVQRDSAREQLLSAARTGRLGWHDGPMVDVFVRDRGRGRSHHGRLGCVG